MSYRTLLKEAKKRDESLVAYHKKHPRVRQRALARMFKITQARVNQILKKYRGGETLPGVKADTWYKVSFSTYIKSDKGIPLIDLEKSLNQALLECISSASISNLTVRESKLKSSETPSE